MWVNHSGLEKPAKRFSGGTALKLPAVLCIALSCVVVNASAEMLGNMSREGKKERQLCKSPHSRD